MSDDGKKSGISRRNFLKGVGGGVVVGAALGSTITSCTKKQQGPEGSEMVGPGNVQISLSVNGKSHKLEIEPRVTLLDAIRDHLGYTGTKRVCNRGQCGACTVILDGRTVLACSMLAIDADGKKVETIEGLANGNNLHPVQEAFIKHDALQCGFCTPGFIMSSVELLEKNKNPNLNQIKAGVSGNICRCGTYPNIFAAVEDAANIMKRGG
jgi:aerobic-type carbon monoxide dehydrogenase small subunit (CoxS/CutS family)